MVKGSVCCSAQARVENPVFDTNFVLEFILLISCSKFWSVHLMSFLDFRPLILQEKKSEEGGTAHKYAIIFCHVLLSICYFSLFESFLSKFSHQKRRGERREHEDAKRVTVKSTREGG